jgi:hypothetical protein
MAFLFLDKTALESPILIQKIISPTNIINYEILIKMIVAVHPESNAYS